MNDKLVSAHTRYNNDIVARAYIVEINSTKGANLQRDYKLASYYEIISQAKNNTFIWLYLIRKLVQ